MVHSWWLLSLLLWLPNRLDRGFGRLLKPKLEVSQLGLIRGVWLGTLVVLLPAKLV